MQCLKNHQLIVQEKLLTYHHAPAETYTWI